MSIPKNCRKASGLNLSLHADAKMAVVKSDSHRWINNMLTLPTLRLRAGRQHLNNPLLPWTSAGKHEHLKTCPRFNL